MDRRGVLAVVSVAQLASGLAGMSVAVRRRHPYDFLMLHGSADSVRRDSILMGTALSAPVVMLAAQGVATARLVQQQSRRAERMLGALGALLVVGYLGETLVRRRLQPSGWDSVESPLAATSLALAAAMAVAARAANRPRP